MVEMYRLTGVERGMMLERCEKFDMDENQTSEPAKGNSSRHNRCCTLTLAVDNSRVEKSGVLYVYRTIQSRDCLRWLWLECRCRCVGTAVGGSVEVKRQMTTQMTTRLLS